MLDRPLQIREVRAAIPGKFRVAWLTDSGPESIISIQDSNRNVVARINAETGIVSFRDGHSTKLIAPYLYKLGVISEVEGR